MRPPCSEARQRPISPDGERLLAKPTTAADNPDVSLHKRHFALVWYVSGGSLPAAIAKGAGWPRARGQANGKAQPARGEPGTRRKDRAERLDEKLAKSVIEESMEELDGHGVPVIAAPPRKWLAWLLAAVSFASGVTSVYVSASITAHHLPARWKTQHYLPEAPAFVAFLLGAIAVIWLGRYNRWDKYGKTERIGLGIVLGLAVLLGFIGFMILTQQEPYNCCAGG